MARLPTIVSVPLGALLLTLAASSVGLGVNAMRRAIPLVAPFPYEQDCPDKVNVPTGPTVDPAAALPLLKTPQVLFLDARPAQAFAAGHIQGARSLPFSFIEPVDAAAAALLKRVKHIIVYCDSPGDRLASLLADQLREQGLTSVKVLHGGWPAFQRLRRAP